MRALLLAVGVATILAPSGPPVEVSPLISITSTSDDPTAAAALVPILRRAQARVEQFFGTPFTTRVIVDLAPDRAGFDVRLAARWNQRNGTARGVA